jgi:hypothetical protein
MNSISRPLNSEGFAQSQQIHLQSAQDDIVTYSDQINGTRQNSVSKAKMGQDEDLDFDMKRPPYLHAMLAGGIGGTTGDILLHSLDTVKTRQQGDPHFPPKYNSLSDSYTKIFRQEGFRRGLYGGFTAAMLGSFPGTVLFFGAYESTKRTMLDRGINPTATFLASGMSLYELAAVSANVE